MLQARWMAIFLITVCESAVGNAHAGVRSLLEGAASAVARAGMAEELLAAAAVGLAASALALLFNRRAASRRA